VETFFSILSAFRSKFRKTAINTKVFWFNTIFIILNIINISSFTIILCVSLSNILKRLSAFCFITFLICFCKIFAHVLSNIRYFHIFFSILFLFKFSHNSNFIRLLISLTKNHCLDRRFKVINQIFNSGSFDFSSFNMIVFAFLSFHTLLIFFKFF